LNNEKEKQVRKQRQIHSFGHRHRYDPEDAWAVSGTVGRED
jgi:hypothetical protein